MKIKVMQMLMISLLIISFVLAQENPPTAQEISNQIQAYWKDYKFDELEAYINQLYQNYPNYIPAILAKSFYHSAFRNHLIDALAELNRVAEAVKNNPQLGSQDFREMLEGEMGELKLSIKIDQETGRTQEQRSAAVNVKEVRDAWGDYPLPYFELIAISPNESI